MTLVGAHIHLCTPQMLQHYVRYQNITRVRESLDLANEGVRNVCNLYSTFLPPPDRTERVPRCCEPPSSD